MSPPNSKCLQRLIGFCLRYLHSVHSIRRTIFLVVFAWNRTQKLILEFHSICKSAIQIYLHFGSWNYLLSEYWFSLTTKTLLLTVVTTTSLWGSTFLGFLVLCHFVQLVDFAFFAESTALFWYIHLKNQLKNQTLISRFNSTNFSFFMWNQFKHITSTLWTQFVTMITNSQKKNGGNIFAINAIFIVNFSKRFTRINKQWPNVYIFTWIYHGWFRISWFFSNYFHTHHFDRLFFVDETNQKEAVGSCEFDTWHKIWQIEILNAFKTYPSTG